MKTCTKCKETKPLSAFSKHRNTKDGYAYHCKECNKKRSREWRITPSGIFTTLKSQSKFFNKGDVGFTRERFIVWYDTQPKFCAYCDLPEKYMKAVNDDWNNRMHRLEIDRINNELGYIEENVVLACPRCNMIKSDYFTFEEMRRIGQNFVKPKWMRELKS